ncbi:YybH family protein [Lysobacter fragariae]
MRIAAVALSAAVLASTSLLASLPVFAATPASVPTGTDECAVWNRELAFARSVADHDATAFAGHISEQAVFGPGRAQSLRGPVAVVKAWAGIIDGSAVRLQWYPERVTLASPDLAWSTGPALYEDPDPKATVRYRLGHFHSVWRREADGAWRVVFDDGIQPQPATDAQVEAFHAGRSGCGN